MAVQFADLFEHAVDAFPQRAAVISGDRRVTYRELEERSNKLAHYLAGAGVTPGAHVGVYARNSIEVIETILAVCKIRAAAVNINYRYTERELRSMVADADLVALVHDRSLAPAVAEAGVGPLATVVIEDAAGEDAAGEDAAGEDCQGVSYADVLAAGSAERDFPPRSADDVYVIYTGGTTGYPKGVMWRHEDIWRTLAGGIDFMTGVPLPDEYEQSRRGLESGGTVRLNVAPLIHGAAQVAVLGGLFSGDTVVLLSQFDADSIWRAIERHKVSGLLIIGDAMARPLIDAYRAGAYDASSLLAISSSAALFSPAVKAEFAAVVPHVVFSESIGSTETGFTGMAVTMPGTATAGAAGTGTGAPGGGAGTPRLGGPTVRPGPDTIVLDDQGRPVGPGETGLIGRGGHVPLGYYKDPVKTAALFAEVDGKRYAVPGDMARVEADGRITLLGRGNTCVNTGGEKVFPEEVESALKSHPDVFDAVVIGVPDERLGQRVAALVRPREGCVLDVEALTAYLRGQIAGYKVPRSTWLVSEIGRTAAGKADYGWAHRHVTTHSPAARFPP